MKNLKIIKKGHTISPKKYLYEKRRRTFFSLFFTGNKKIRRGSMAVEAALVMPLFMFAMLNLNSLMNLYEMQLRNNFSIYEKVRTTCASTALISKMGFDYKKDVVLFDLYEGKPAIGILGYNEIPMVSIFSAKPWTGYYIDENTVNDESETVYVTPNGDAYHSTDSCPYLKLSLEMINRQNVGDRRNADGEKYKPCPGCGKGLGDSVFITAYGNQYHTSLECSSLKRTIIEVSAETVENRHKCPKCFGD